MINTECGIFGCISNTYLPQDLCIDGLKNLQHRGRESFGISYLQGSNLLVEKYIGEVTDISYSQSSCLWLGHVRYSTSGNIKNNLQFTQPLLHTNNKYLGQYIIAHNGNIPQYVWNTLYKKYTDFVIPLDKTYNDTQLLVLFIEFLAKKMGDIEYLWKQILINILNDIPGAYSLVVLTLDETFLLRDKYAIRPLIYTEINSNNNTIFISSENCAFSEDFPFKDVGAGEIIKINNNDLTTEKLYKIPENELIQNCVFEYIYFLRGGTTVDGISAKAFRSSLGVILSQQIRVQTQDIFDSWRENDALICGVPVSGIHFGNSMATALNLEYSQFLTKRTGYPYRSFIMKTTEERLEACKRKFQIQDNTIRDRVIVLVDDSIVRGNTLVFLVKFLKSYQPKEIHFISGSPPVKHPCHYGMDFPDIEELVANQIPRENLAQHFGLDSLTYLDINNLIKITQKFDLSEKNERKMCNACFTGNYLF